MWPFLVELEKKEQEIEQLRLDREHLKARLEMLQADSMREKKVGALAELRRHCQHTPPPPTVLVAMGTPTGSHLSGLARLPGVLGSL